MNFKGRTAIITGAGRGLGLVYARALAERGAQVLINDPGTDRSGVGTDAAVVQEAARSLQADGLSVLGDSSSLAEEAGCQQLIARALDAFGGLDILIHNAGWVGYQPIETVDSGFIERAVAVNIQAPIWLCKHAWPHLRQSPAPRVVLTTSDRAMYQRYAQPGLVAYAAGKMAQLGIMNALSMEGAAHGILVNAVSPVAKTRMWGITGQPPDLTPEAVAPGVVYLASADCHDSGYILRASNGQFSATRFEENPGVDYPLDLARVHAASATEVARLWASIKESRHA
ncbi:SDR family NAD(P)-dependent oxidoreductase [Pseudomonas sp. CF161]|uniref:SDR family NAD(P)-dependent oxidoreductase n=1 Tax=Pseudomonas sp. CF161 TaxID=911241 RepID=UPI0003551F50|nr:SDR family NAD(P)-dependent oxidoreductase [Pseudomonas sp. CF161]EPL09828.1 short chain dehydrogenase/reductase family oxidoreductase [Pseudomonas sp. CF161]